MNGTVRALLNRRFVMKTIHLFDAVMGCALLVFPCFIELTLVTETWRLSYITTLNWSIAIAGLIVVMMVLYRWKTNTPARATWLTLAAGMMAIAGLFTSSAYLLNNFGMMHIMFEQSIALLLFTIGFGLLVEWWSGIVSSEIPAFLIE
jgi:hypothetical protein